MPRFYRLLADFITGCNVGQDSSLTTAPVIAILSIGFIIESYWGKKLSPETKDNMNRHSRTMFMKPCKRACFLLLMLFLSSCGQVAPPATETSTIPPFAWTAVAHTQTALFTPVVLSTQTPSPEPTQLPFPFFTPNAIQVERWQEYQLELARIIFPNDQPEWFLCEWAILGYSGQELYVWAVCGIGERFGSVPVVITLNSDGSIQNVKKPGNWTVENIHKMFPEDVRNKFNYMEAGESQKMLEHLDWRWAHTGEPPLIVLNAMPAITPTP